MTTSSDSSLPDGTNEAPTSPSSTGNVQQGSENSQHTKADYDSLKARLDKMEREAQGNKDRAVKRTNERLDKFEDELKPLLESAQKYITAGSSINDAIEQVQKDHSRSEADAALREMALAWKSGRLPNSPAGNGQSEGVDVTEVLNDLGLSLDDPVVKVAFEGRKFTQEEAELTAAKLLRQKKQLPTPTQAQQASMPVTPKAGMSEQLANTLYAELGNLLKSPSQNKARIDTIKKELTAGGFPL